MNNKNLNSLLNILKKEADLYKRLLDIAKEKKETLIENEIDTLFDHIENDQILIDKINKLEDKRNELMIEIKENHDIKNIKESSYQNFINKLPPQWKEKLNPIRQRLLDILDEFHRLNEENKRLIKEAVKYNRFSIDLIIEHLNKNKNTYHSKSESSPHLLDTRG